MLGIFRKARISTKLTGTVAAALVSLCIVGAIAIVAARTIQSLGHDLYIESDRVSNVQMGLTVGLERAISEVHSAPSELDLNQLKATRTRFGALVAQVKRLLAGEQRSDDDAAMRAGAEQMAQRITAFEGEAKKVFDLSDSFAQPDAIAALSQVVAPTQAAAQEALLGFRNAANRRDAAKVAAMQGTATTVTRVVIGLVGLIVVALSVLAYIVVSRGVVR